MRRIREINPYFEKWFDILKNSKLFRILIFRSNFDQDGNFKIEGR